MDPLLRAAIERRDLEAALLAVEGDHAAAARCIGCGKVVGETLKSLSCTACGFKQGRPGTAVFELFQDARRAQLERISKRLEQLQRDHEDGMDPDRKCTECGKRLRSNCVGDVCWACRHTRAKPLDGPPPGPERTIAAAPPAAKAERVRDPMEERFRLLTLGLGLDGAQLLRDFMRDWVERVEQAVHDRITMPVGQARPPVVEAANNE